jgi:hypothetical protein
VAPLLGRRFPGLPHAAARLDRGSEVLGFDTPRSTDHDWGPRFTLYLGEADLARHGAAIDRALAAELPAAVRGYPTNFAPASEGGHPVPSAPGAPIAHRVVITTVPRYFTGYVGFDPLAPDVSHVEWLLAPAQRLRTVAAGAVFHDDLALEAARRALAWYPPDLWLYAMASQWRRIGQEEAFVGRCGDVGDELGSRVVAARLVQELMRLCFLIERQYPPYTKWFGSGFARLACAPRLTDTLHAVLSAADWRERERQLSAAYLVAGEMHNALGVTPHVEPRIARFHGRPYLVPHADRFADTLTAAIASDTVRRLPPGVGAIWQFADSTDVLDEPARWEGVRGVYGRD